MNTKHIRKYTGEKTTCFLVDMSDFAAFNDVYRIVRGEALMNVGEFVSRYLIKHEGTCSSKWDGLKGKLSITVSSWSR